MLRYAKGRHKRTQGGEIIYDHEVLRLQRSKDPQKGTTIWAELLSTFHTK